MNSKVFSTNFLIAILAVVIVFGIGFYGVTQQRVSDPNILPSKPAFPPPYFQQVTSSKFNLPTERPLLLFALNSSDVSNASVPLTFLFAYHPDFGKILIKEFSTIRTLQAAQYDSNLLRQKTVFYYTYTEEKEDGKWDEVLVKVDPLNASELEIARIHRGNVGGTPISGFKISQSEKKIVWCEYGQTQSGEPNEKLIVKDLITGSMRVIQDNRACACRLGSSGPSFSRDGDSLYYTMGFWELYGDPTDEEVLMWEKQDQHGFHVIDINSGEDTWLYPSYEKISVVRLWDNVSVSQDEQIFLSYTTLSSDITSIVVKRYSDPNFEYFTNVDVESLPIHYTLQIPGWVFDEERLTIDGRGLVFRARSEESYQDFAFGYLDIQTKKLIFPIPNMPNERFYIFEAISQNSFYLLKPKKLATDNFDLYETDINGNMKLIDSHPGYFTFLHFLQ